MFMLKCMKPYDTVFCLPHTELPEIRSMAEEVQVVLNHGTVLPCEVQGFPRPSITWQREGVPIATGNGTKNMSQILIYKETDR